MPTVRPLPAPGEITDLEELADAVLRDGPGLLVGYARVSTADGRQKLDLQTVALIKAGVDPRHIFTDMASGLSSTRPGLARCLAFLRPGDRLVVWKVDRLSRKSSFILSTLDDLGSREIDFQSLTEDLDTTTPVGRMLFNFAAVLAQFESEQRSERIRAGQAVGKKGGRPRALTDQQVIMLRKYIADNPNLSQNQVARAFNIKRGTLVTILARASQELDSADGQSLSQKDRD